MIFLFKSFISKQFKTDILENKMDLKSITIPTNAKSVLSKFVSQSLDINVLKIIRSIHEDPIGFTGLNLRGFYSLVIEDGENKIHCFINFGFSALHGVIFDGRSEYGYFFGIGDRDIVASKQVIDKFAYPVITGFLGLNIKLTAAITPTINYGEGIMCNTLSLAHYSAEEAEWTTTYCNWYESVMDAHIRHYVSTNDSSLMKDELQRAWIEHADVSLLNTMLDKTKAHLLHLESFHKGTKSKYSEKEYYNEEEPIRAIMKLDLIETHRLINYLEMQIIASKYQRQWLHGK